MDFLLYLIPVAVVLLVFSFGFVYSRKMSKRISNITVETVKEKRQYTDRIYEKAGIKKASEHPLGEVQTVIRGRIRFVFFAIILFSVAVLGLYILHFTEREFYVSRTGLNMLITTVLLFGSIAWAFQLFSFTLRKIKLRRRGFELCDIWGSKMYEYKDVEFYLSETIEHKHESDGYRPLIKTAGNYNYIWVCQVLFKDGHTPLLLKSSHYSWFHSKMQALLDGLTWVE